MRTTGAPEIELNDAVLDQLDIDDVLVFAEHVVTNAARHWMELDLVQKQRLQQVVFPEGLRFDGEICRRNLLDFQEVGRKPRSGNWNGVPSRFPLLVYAARSLDCSVIFR